jgi:predicted ATPase
MEEPVQQSTPLIGRESELSVLLDSFGRAKGGKGQTVLVAGEAGIGKTRLVSEMLDIAGSDGANVIKGWCLAESLEPLMPIKSGLRAAGYFHLISGEPPPTAISSYLMDDAGVLIIRAERETSQLDPDIFTSMLKAVGDFVRDSMSMMGKGTGGGLNSLGYEKYRILVQTSGKLSLAMVIQGDESEFLIQDMKRTLAEIGNKLDGWGGDPSEASEFIPKITWFIESGKYDGKFLVDNPAILQENLFDSVLMGLQRLSADKPMVFFLDDLQWADPSTLGLFHYLARNTRENNILLLGTYRPEDIVSSKDGAAHQLETAMQNMSREGLFQRLELQRLGPEDCRRIIGSQLGKAALEPGFVEKVYRETDGTPLFILEVIKLLVMDKALEQDPEGTWKLAGDIDRLDIPSKVYDVVKRRLDRLMKEQREILDCASVVGEEFQSDVLERTVGMNKIQLLKNLSEIERSHRLIHSFQKKYLFDHAKIREVLYNGIMDELRQEYHRTVADTLAELYGDAADEVVSKLAYHYAEANDRRAGQYLAMAGDKARERYANDEAIRLYSRAMDFIGKEEQPAILEKLGDIEFMLGEYDRAKEYFGRTGAAAADSETAARMLRKTGDIHISRGNYEEALRTLGEARAARGAGTLESGRISVSEGNANYITGKYDKAMSLFLEALATFQKSNAGQTDMGKVLRAIGNIHYLRGEYDKAISYFEKSLEATKSINDILGISAALNNIGVVHNDLGDMDKALEFYEESLEIVRNTGAKTFTAKALNNIGIVYNNKGKLDKALQYMQRGLEIEKKLGNSHGIAESMNNIGVVYVDMGERDKALEYYMKSLEIRERIGEKRGIGFSHFNMGNSYSNKGEYAKAAEHYRKSLGICQELGDASMIVYNRCGLAAVSIGQGDLPKALEYAEKAAETATELGRNFENGMGHQALGTVYREMRDWDRATEEFDKALASLEHMDAKKLVAETLYEYAAMHGAKGGKAEAKQMYGRALSIFEDMGIVDAARKTRAALEGLGGAGDTAGEIKT